MIDSTTGDIQFCKAEFIYNLFQGSSTKYAIFDTRNNSIEKSLNTSICLKKTNFDDGLSSSAKIGYANNENQSPSANTNTFTTPQSEPEESQEEKSHIFSRLPPSNNSKFSFAELETMVPHDSKEKLKTLKRRYCVIIMNDEKLLYDYFMEDKTNNIDFARKNCFKKDRGYLQNAINSTYLQEIETLNRDDELESIEFGLELYEVLRSQKVRTVYILLDGANQLFEKYPFLNCKSSVIPKLDFKFPNEMLNGRIYLGDQSQVFLLKKA